MPRRELLTLSLYQLLASNRSGIWIVYFPLFLVDSRGASEPVALALMSAAYVASSLLGPIAGRWSDRVGRRRPFLLGAEVAALPLFLAIPYLPTALEAGGAFVAALVALSFGSPALSAYVTDLTRDRERGRGFGLLNASSSGGGIAGFAIAAALAATYGYPSLFYFAGAVMVGTILVVVLLVPDRPSAPGSVRQPLAAYRPLATFSVTVSVRSLGIGAVGSFYGLYAVSLGASPFDVSAIAIAGLAAMTVASLTGGRFVDRRGEIGAIWYGTLVTFAGIVLFLVASTWWLLVPAQAIRSVGLAYLSPGMLAYVANRAPPGHRAEHLGIFALVNSTFWSLGPLAGGLALEAGGAVALFGFALVATILSLAAIELLYVTRGRRRAAAGGSEGNLLGPAGAPAPLASAAPPAPPEPGPGPTPRGPVP